MGRNRLRVLVAAALGGFLLAWLVYDRVWAEGDARPLTWRTATIDRLQLARPAFEVFRDRRELDEFLNERAPGVAIVPPRVDFDRDLAVLLATGARSSTGYAIEVLRIEERRGNVRVVARERSPRLGDIVAPRVEYPAVLVIIRDVGKPVSVRWAS